MFIWGWSTKVIGTNSTNLLCRACKNQHLVLIGQQKMFDIFWIPTIPLKKYRTLFCESCGTSYPIPNDLYPEFLQENQEETDVTQFKTPWWSFFGIYLIITIVIIGIVFDGMENKKIKEFIKNPYVGAVFTFNTGESQFPHAFATIERIDKDKIALRLSNHTYSRGSATEKIAKEKLSSNFSEELTEFSLHGFKNIKIEKIVK